MLARPDDRILIIGNSGSGKSTLAGRLAANLHVTAYDLDLMYWESDHYGKKRAEVAARRMVSEAAAQNRWIIEGVFGWLAEVAAQRATMLVWLDLPWNDCREGLLERGPHRGGTFTEFDALLKWAEAYWTRATSSSFSGHLEMFESFSGSRFRLKSRDERNEFGRPSP